MRLKVAIILSSILLLGCIALSEGMSANEVNSGNGYKEVKISCDQQSEFVL